MYLPFRGNYRRLKSQSDITKTMLQSVLDRLGVLLPNIPVPPWVRSTSAFEETPLSPISPISSPSAGRKKPVLKVSPPTDFNGDCAKGKAFLTSCRTYMQLCPEAFMDDMTRVIWALSFMKANRASWWAQKELEHLYLLSFMIKPRHLPAHLSLSPQ